MRRKNKDMPKLIAAGTTLAVLCGALGYLAIDGVGQVSADEHGCYGRSDAPKIVAVIDASEPRWDKTQQRAINTYFEKAYRGLGPNQRLAVYTTQVDKVASIAEPVFHICGQAESPEELPDNAVQAQAGYLKRQKQRSYDEVFKPELDKILAIEIDESKRQVYESPIFEMLRTVSHWENINLSSGGYLIVVSDGIQSTESARFCSVAGAMPKFSVFKQSEVYQARLKLPPLGGVNVKFLFLQRGGYGEGSMRFCSSEEEIRTFWKGAFRDADTSVDFIRIRSGAEQ